MQENNTHLSPDSLLSAWDPVKMWLKVFYIVSCCTAVIHYQSLSVSVWWSIFSIFFQNFNMDIYHTWYCICSRRIMETEQTLIPSIAQLVERRTVEQDVYLHSCRIFQFLLLLHILKRFIYIELLITIYKVLCKDIKH